MSESSFSNTPKGLKQGKDDAFSLTEVLLDEEVRIKDLLRKKRETDKPSPDEEPLLEEKLIDQDALDKSLPSYADRISNFQAVPPELVAFRKNRSMEGLQRDALCMSGGGIRSACINLGVAQGLAEKSLLSKFHYLSTVSGGGYIGCWLSTWIKALRKRGTAGNVSDIEEKLWKHEQVSEAEEITNLRVNSNYLTPRIGALSVDLFTCLMIIVRNMIVNWLVLIPCFAACVAASMIVLQIGSRLIDFLQMEKEATLAGADATIFLTLNGLIAICVMPIFARAQKEPGTFGAMSSEYQRLMTYRWVLTLMASFALAIWIHAIPQPSSDSFLLSNARDKSEALNKAEVSDKSTALDKSGASDKPIASDKTVASGNPHPYLDYWPVYALIILPYLFGIPRAFTKNSEAPVDKRSTFFWPQVFLAFILSATLSYAVARGLIAFLCPVPQVVTSFFEPISPLFKHTLYLAVAPSAWIMVFEIQNFLMIGFLSMITNDEDREWWARSNGSMILLALGWFAICITAAYGPALCTLFALPERSILAVLASQFTLGGVISLLAGSAKTPATTKDRPAPWRTGLLQVAAILFFAFLALLLAAANFKIAAGMQKGAISSVLISTGTSREKTDVLGGRVHIQKTDKSFNLTTSFDLASKSAETESLTLPAIRDWFWVLVLWVVITAAASWAININQFSIQCLYRNRLLRCFVGAVRRAPAQINAEAHKFEPFTGFDTTDNYDVSELRFQLPFHVINTAQNLIKSTNLAWQQRMASSFTISPLHTGGELTGYRSTKEFGKGISIGTAMATSGAAVNPSMGHATSPILELLMTLFNVRLGWWVGNPKETAWEEVGPRLALQPLLSEMFGQTSEGQEYVLLSDGGHFEDLAIYEMIQRRCRFLLVVDGGADPTGNFEDLGNAVRKVRIDLGVEIDFLFNRTSNKLAKTKDARQHFAVAKIIYSNADGTKADEDGWLLYVKCCLNGDESQDIYQYKQFYPDFPHQTTMDQWFDESQFESYRALGRHSILRTLEALSGYTNRQMNFLKNTVPGAVTAAELGGRKAEFVEFLRFMEKRGFI